MLHHDPQAIWSGDFLWWAVQDLHTVRPAVPVVVPPCSAGTCLPVQQEKAQQKSSSAEAELPGLRYGVNQRLLNWGARRAAFRPYSPDLDPKRPVFMRFFGLSSLSKPIGKPTKSRNFWCSLTQPECSIHNAA